MSSKARSTIQWVCLVLAGGWVCLVLAGSFMTGGGGRNGEAGRAEFEVNKSLFAAIAKADRLVLHEGLPHQGNEPDLFEEEKRGKATVEFHGYLFYSGPLDVPAADAERIKQVLGAEDSFRQWTGENKCLFHPDYLAEWRVGEATYRVLLCFGCSEVQVLGPDHTLRCEIVQKQLKEFLTKYRKNRPSRPEL